jgi:hypothetical protein
LEQLFSTLSNQKIYNLSNGAYFTNTTPTTQEQLDIQNQPVINKTNLLDTIQENLDQISISDLSDTTLQVLAKEKQLVEQIKELDDNMLLASISGQIILGYKKLIYPYAQYITDNVNIKYKAQIESIKHYQLDILQDELKQTLNCVV